MLYACNGRRINECGSSDHAQLSAHIFACFCSASKIFRRKLKTKSDQIWGKKFLARTLCVATIFTHKHVYCVCTHDWIISIKALEINSFANAKTNVFPLARKKYKYLFNLIPNRCRIDDACFCVFAIPLHKLWKIECWEGRKTVAQNHIIAVDPEHK